MKPVWINCIGSRDGAVVRALASHQCGSGSIPARCHMWVESVVGLAFLRGFTFSPGSPVLFPLQRPTFPNSNRPFPNYL